MFRTSHNAKTRMDMLSRTYCHTLNSDSMEGAGDPSSLFLETVLLSQVKCYPPSDRGQAAGQGVAQSAQHPGQEGHHAFEASLGYAIRSCLQIKWNVQTSGLQDVHRTKQPSLQGIFRKISALCLQFLTYHKFHGRTGASCLSILKHVKTLYMIRRNPLWHTCSVIALVQQESLPS